MVAHRLPHRPVRADFPHTVRPVTVWPWRSRPCSLSAGVPCTWVGSLCIRQVSSRQPRDRASPFPTPRLRAAPFAGFLRYYEPAKTPVTLLPVLPLSVEPRYLGVAPAVSFHSVGKPGRRGQDVGGPVHPFPVFIPKDAHGSPMFPGNPSVPVPCSPTPAGPRPLAATGLRCCPRRSDYEGSSNDHDFEAHSHGLSTGCLRFVPPLLTTTQNSLPGGG